MVIPWLYHGYTMVIPWLYHGYTMVIPWLYHGFTMLSRDCESILTSFRRGESYRHGFGILEMTEMTLEWLEIERCLGDESGGETSQDRCSLSLLRLVQRG
jgi:hypothetical protein